MGGILPALSAAAVVAVVFSFVFYFMNEIDWSA